MPTPDSILANKAQDGDAVSIGDVNSEGNAGKAIDVGDTTAGTPSYSTPEDLAKQQAEERARAEEELGPQNPSSSTPEGHQRLQDYGEWGKSMSTAIGHQPTVTKAQ
jgi:hypothetical protein